MENNDIMLITKEEASKLLFEDTPTEIGSTEKKESIFDIYGNYSYPFEAQIEKPNIATGYVFVNTTPID